MADRCVYEGSCPMGEDIIELTGACDSARGEKCGPAAAFGMLEHQYDGLKELDELSPIVGSFKFTVVPQGMPPEEVRREWVGVEVPVRHPDRLQAGEVEVSPTDAVLSLLSQGKLDATDWFMRAGISLVPLGPRWIFQATEGDFTPSEATESSDFYGARLSEELRTAISDS